MEMEKDEQRIYLKDLLFTALYAWKKIIIAAVVMSVLLGVYGLVFGAMSEETQRFYQMEIAEYETKKEVLEQREQIIEQNITAQEDYLEHSVLMRLDPIKYYVATLTLYIETDYQIQPNLSYQDPDKTSSVLNAYRNAILSGSTVEALAETVNTKTQYVSELIDIDLPANTSNMIITVKCESEESAKTVLKTLMRQMMEVAPSIKEAITGHTVTVLEENVRERTSQDIANQQRDEAGALDNLMKTRITVAETRSKLKAPSSPYKKVFVYFVLGAIAGAALCVCCAWVFYLAGGKVYSARTLSSRTDLKVLGCVRTKSYKGIDALLRKWEDRAMSKSMDRVLMDICCRVEGAKCIMVVGSGNTTPLVNAMRERLPDVRVAHGDILSDVSAFHMLTTCDCVLAVEQCGVSRYEDISRRANMISDYNKPVIGCVLLDG